MSRKGSKLDELNRRKWCSHRRNNLFFFLLCQASGLSGCERSNFWTVKLTCLSLLAVAFWLLIQSWKFTLSTANNYSCFIPIQLDISFLSSFVSSFLSLLLPIHFLWLTSFWTRLNSEIMRPVLKVVNKEIKLGIPHHLSDIAEQLG